MIYLGATTRKLMLLVGSFLLSLPPTYMKYLIKSCWFYLIDDLSNLSILSDVTLDQNINTCYMDNCSSPPTGPLTSTLASLKSIFLIAFRVKQVMFYSIPWLSVPPLSFRLRPCTSFHWPLYKDNYFYCLKGPEWSALAPACIFSHIS